MKPYKAYLKLSRQEIINGNWVNVDFGYKLISVLAEGSGYAMVRYPRCMPFVVTSKNLFLTLPEGAKCLTQS